MDLSANVTGAVKWSSDNGDYGFIALDSDADSTVFIHISDVPEGIKKIEAGQRFRFAVMPNKKGPRAANVELVR